MVTKARTRNKRKTAKAVLALTLCTALAASMGAGSASAATRSYRDLMPDDGKYYTDYNTYDEAKAAGEEFTAEVAAEGQTLLKNKKTGDRPALPLAGTERVSVFGVGSDAPAGNGVSIHEALKAEGFKVNPTLTSYYAGIGTTFGTEVNNFSKVLENSFKTYNDVAVVVLSRGGGEGSDMPTVTKEEANDAKENDGWTHGGYTAQQDGKKYKHFLQMTNSEYELFEYVKAQGFKKIVYLINVSEIFEIKNLADDEAVDGIIWMGRPGAQGARSTAKILNGKINPSGKTVDTWYSDFTQDPTWFNAVNNAQVGSSIAYTVEGKKPANAYNGVDYEEDIYLGYRYYETKAADMNNSSSGTGDTWYQKAVTYPFGFGLSYTTYTYSNMTVKLGNEELGATLDASKIESRVGQAAQEDTLTVTVDVKNDGTVAGKESVQIYVQAPYITGQVEKSHVKLVGFGKTGMLRPGETETLTITVNVQDLASYDYTDANKNGWKGYEIDVGNYSLMALPNAHGWAASPLKHDFEVTNGSANDQGATYNATHTKAAYLQLDDYSGNEIKNLFSKENSMYYSLRDNSGAYKFNAKETANEVLMSRANGLVLPTAPTADDMSMSADMYKSLTYWDNFYVDNKVPDDVIAGNSKAESPVYYKDGQTIENIVAPADFTWMAETDAAVMTNWDQRGDYKYAAGGTTVKMSDMSGIDPYGTKALTAQDTDVTELVGKTGQQAWELFMNSLSWEDLMKLVGNLQKKAFPEISMNTMADAEFAYSVAGINFTCTCTLAGTWNTELAYRKGVIAANAMLLQGKNTGWGTSANTHRSPFGGRAFEYTSEDGILGGYISAAETYGANSRGIATYVKHCALNDQETSRNGRNLFAWVSEQAMREIYYKAFQMTAQEGQAAGIMGAFARAGRVAMNSNYQFVTGLFRKEWGCSTISFTTDMYAGGKSAWPLDLIVRAGTDTIATNTMSGKWDATKKTVVLTDATDTTSAKNQWYTTRRCAMIFLWTHANTAMNNNGLDVSAIDYETKEYSVKYGMPANVNLGVDGSKVGTENLVYTATGLPAGLSINGATGLISGSTKELGAYNVSVTVTADGWIKKSVTVKLNVVPNASLEAGKAVPAGTKIDATVKVGDGYNGNTTRPITAVICELVDEIPGLEMDEDGNLTGTPTAPGTYAVTMKQTIYYTQNNQTRNATVNVSILIVVAGEGGEVTPPVDPDEPLTAEQVQDMIDAALKNVGGLTEAQVKQIVDAAIAGMNGGLTKAEVQDMIDKALADYKPEGGCGGVIGATSALVAAIAVLGGAGLVLRKKKED